ncbi:MAG: F0F1 ATP synthase subunit delta [Actinomycetota bacterium]
MLFDWFTTIAQIVNFVILIALLKHFLYDRVLEATDRRRQDLADQRAEARTAREEAEAEARRHREKIEEMEASSDQLMREARAEAGQKREELFEDARDEMERRREEWRRALDSEKERFADQVATRVGHSALEIAERVLAELAGTPVEEAMADGFIRRLGRLDDDERAHLSDAVGNGDGDVTLVSSFELDDDRRAELADAVTEHLGVEIGQFATDRDLIAGLRLEAGGRVVGWSVRDHLDTLASELGDTLDQGQAS